MRRSEASPRKHQAGGWGAVLRQGGGRFQPAAPPALGAALRRARARAARRLRAPAPLPPAHKGTQRWQARGARAAGGAGRRRRRRWVHGWVGGAQGQDRLTPAGWREANERPCRRRSARGRGAPRGGVRRGGARRWERGWGLPAAGRRHGSSGTQCRGKGHRRPSAGRRRAHMLVHSRRGAGAVRWARGSHCRRHPLPARRCRAGRRTPARRRRAAGRAPAPHAQISSERDRVWRRSGR